MWPRFRKPSHLVEALHNRIPAARSRLHKLLHDAVVRIMDNVAVRFHLRYDRAILNRYALHAVETYLRTREPVEFEHMSWSTFRTVALVPVAKMAIPLPVVDQWGLVVFPDPLPECSAYRSQTLFLPCEKVGDYWVGGDWFGGAKAEDGALWVILADVSGHGYCAYLLASCLPDVWRASWHALASACPEPLALLRAMHCLLEDCLPEGVYVEGTLARLQPGGEVIVLPAGGTRLLLRRNGQRQVALHTLRGAWLGLVPPDAEDQRSWTLCAEDELVLASDGLFDQFADHRESIHAFTSILTRAKDPVTLFDALSQALQEVLRDQPQKDDITAVMLRRTGGAVEFSQGSPMDAPMQRDCEEVGQQKKSD